MCVNHPLICIQKEDFSAFSSDERKPRIGPESGIPVSQRFHFSHFFFLFSRSTLADSFVKIIRRIQKEREHKAGRRINKNTKCSRVRSVPAIFLFIARQPHQEFKFRQICMPRINHLKCVTSSRFRDYFSSPLHEKSVVPLETFWVTDGGAAQRSLVPHSGRCQIAILIDEPHRTRDAQLRNL